MRAATVTLVSTLASAPAIITIALFFVLVDDPGATWGPWPAVVAVACLAGAVLAEVVGYRVRPVPAGTAPEAADTSARAQWQSGLVLRFVLCEAPFILTVAMVFVVPLPQPILVVALAAVLATAAICFHCWPWGRPVGKVADALEVDGARTRLREELSSVVVR